MTTQCKYQLCDGNGIAVVDATVYRCACERGAHIQPSFAPSDKKKERPITLKRLSPPVISGREKAAGDT